MLYRATFLKFLLPPALCLIIAPFISMFALAQSKPVTQLFPNLSFANEASGWYLRDAEVVADASGDLAHSIMLHGVTPGPNSWSHVGISIRPIPTDHKLSFSCILRGTQKAQK